MRCDLLTVLKGNSTCFLDSKKNNCSNDFYPQLKCRNCLSFFFHWGRFLTFFEKAYLPEEQNVRIKHKKNYLHRIFVVSYFARFFWDDSETRNCKTHKIYNPEIGFTRDLHKRYFNRMLMKNEIYEAEKSFLYR